MQSRKVVVADVVTESRRALVAAINSAENLTVVGETDDGEELLNLCVCRQCDIVVMDLVLFRIDGLEVLEKLRDLPVKPIILVLTAFAFGYMAKLSVAGGADYIMLKPYKAEAVVKRIQQMIHSIDERCFSTFLANALEKAVANTMREVGIPSHIKGFKYLEKAIMLAMEDINAVYNITKAIYPKIAKECETTPNGVERAIRHAIEVAWQRGDIEVQHKYFGYTVSDIKGKPTNSEFISLIADRILMELKMETDISHI